MNGFFLLLLSSIRVFLVIVWAPVTQMIPGKVDGYGCSVSSNLYTGISRLDNDLELVWFFPVFYLEITV